MPVSRFNFQVVRNILLEREQSQSREFFEHLKWSEDNGLIDGAGGLTDKGRRQAALVADGERFTRAVRRNRSVFGATGWHTLVWLLARENSRGRPE